jgi:hypothetical protein
MLYSGNKLMDNGKKSLTFLINKFKLEFNKYPTHILIHNQFCHFFIRIFHPSLIREQIRFFISYRYTTFSNKRTIKVIRRMSSFYSF